MFVLAYAWNLEIHNFQPFVLLLRYNLGEYVVAAAPATT
jgi:hypothetical protein